MSAFSSVSSSNTRTVADNELTYSVLTANVAGAGDLQNLMMDHFEQIPDKKIRKIVQALLADQKSNTRFVTNDQFEKLKDYASCTYQSLINVAFQSFLTDIKPDIICLQEFNPRVNDHKGIAKKLHKQGYEFTKGHDANIAYQTSKFTQVRDKETLGDAMYLDLKDNATGRTLRVISDHVAGFNGKMQKEQTEIARTGDTEQKRAEAKAYKKENTAAKDDRLKVTLDEIKEDLVTRKEEMKKYVDKVAVRSNRTLGFVRNYFSAPLPQEPLGAPTLLIYAGDLNATGKYVSKNKEERLHPKRVALLTDAGFKCDENDREPTIIDANTKTVRKYDYVFSCIDEENKDFTIISTPVRVIKKGSETLPISLYDFMSYPSDHLPVLAKITIFAK